jgi:hypothetical protein
VSNLLADAADVSEIEIPVRLAWRSNANKREIRLVDSCGWVLRSMQTPVSDGFFDNLADLGFYDWRMPAVDQINFIRNRINPNYLVPLSGKTSCGDGSNITQTKDADFQGALHFQVLVCY